MVALSRKDANVVSQQMQGDVFDGPGRAGGGLPPILFRQAREQSQEFSESYREEIEDDDRPRRVQATLASASSRVFVALALMRRCRPNAIYLELGDAFA